MVAVSKQDPKGGQQQRGGKLGRAWEPETREQTTHPREAGGGWRRSCEFAKALSPEHMLHGPPRLHLHNISSKIKIIKNFKTAMESTKTQLLGPYERGVLHNCTDCLPLKLTLLRPIRLPWPNECSFTPKS